jgi:hypothetical protein
MLEKLKEKILEHTLGLVVVPLLLLAGTTVWVLIPLLLSPFWTRIAPQTLQRILGLTLLSVTALLAYVVSLHRKLKGKLRIKFGLFWDKYANPFCPACQSLLTGYMIAYMGGPCLSCVKCSKVIRLTNDDGAELTLPNAKTLVLKSSSWV